MDVDKIIDVVRHLAAERGESEHVEFKRNWHSENELAKDVVAISNVLSLKNILRGYIIFGIDDTSHRIIGTNFSLSDKKVKTEELKLWISHSIHPEPNCEFYDVKIDGKRISVVIVFPITSDIMNYEETEWIRIGANTVKLLKHPQIKKELWGKILSQTFEEQVALKDVHVDEIEELLDLDLFIKLRKEKVPVERDGVIRELQNCKMILDNGDSTFGITNLGAILLAKKLNMFAKLSTKSPRVVFYSGKTKTGGSLENAEGNKGYAVGFEGLYNFILSKVRFKEEIIGSIRKQTYLYPEIVIRELLANCLIHQNFINEGMHPMVEIFSDRIVFSNSGKPMIDTRRFIDNPPVSRNNLLATEMSKLGICEQHGSGWDKIAEAIESDSFVAPDIEVTELATQITVHQRQDLSKLTKNEKLRTLYLHACWLKANNEFLTNSTIRKRFGIGNSALATRLINEAVDAGWIKQFDMNSGKKWRKYVPFWVIGENEPPFSS